MERFTLDSASELQSNYTRNRFAEEIYESVSRHSGGYTCQNCGRSTDRVTPVPEFDYLGCDECMEEAMAVLSREAIERKPARIARMQGELFPGEVA